MNVSPQDRRILRELAAQLAEVAALPIQQERARLWRDFNALRPHRPMVLAFPEGGWRDLLKEEDLRCEDPMLRGWEWNLRSRLFHHHHIHDDQPITRYFNIGWTIRSGSLGVDVTYHRTDALGAHTWDAPIRGAEDLEKLHFRSLEVDREGTECVRDLAQEVFGDLLEVRIHGGLWWTVGLTQTLIYLRGLDQVMLDMYDNPQLLHDLMAFLRDATMHDLDYYEREGLLSLNNGPDDYVGSGGLGAIDELPAEGYQGTARLKDLWTLGESQEFVGVGPNAFHEFALQYQLPLLERFGLTCYGCCEPLDRKLDLLLNHIPNLRRVSVSPWCDRRVAAEKLTDNYVYSWKPNPALICGPEVSWEAVEQTIRETLGIARGCCVEMVMKDTHTFHGDPRRIERWTEIASRLALEAA